jgi:hypothetical protein
MQELNKIEEPIEVLDPEVAEEKPTQASIEQLPLPVLRERLDEKGIVYKSTDKKKDLIKALLTGETTIKVKEKKAAPRLDDSVKPTPLPILSKDLKEQLDKLAAQGLRYEIDEAECCINFFGKIPTSANLDQSVNNIIRTAMESIRIGSMPPETNSTKDM